MNNEIKGYCIQNGTPTPDNAVPIETLALETSAKEMFEKLGYKLISGDNKELINYRVDLDNNNFINIVFNNEYKTFWYGHTRNTYFDGYLRKENSFIPTNIELLQAINKQVEELGWNNAQQ